MKNTELIKIFSRNMKIFRQKLKITQEELGFRSNLHRNYISDAERGRRNITLNVLEKIAEGLEVEPSQLLANIEIKK